MSFPYKTVLMIGCTAGIGLALAERMIENGIFVIGVGRRKERLDAFVAKHGPRKAAASHFDITNLDGMKDWTYPDVDCVFLNSGVQRGLNFTKPEAIDLASVQQEVTTNYMSYVALTTYLLPHLQSLAPRPVALAAVTSGLALVPMPRCANYCATKAALHSLLWSLRAQLASDEASRHVRVVEILPPAVQTELHELQEDLRARGPTNFGMPLAEFTDEVWDALTKGKEEIPVGMVKDRFVKVDDERKEMFQQLVEMAGTT
ncbi:hypothetical protein DL768_008875 [Monosporascus sp. mg162]|nr:hypothetical protein DL768_008875 [Monosporascus sp. mg162]